MSIKNILLPEHNFVYTYYVGRIDDLQVRAYSDQLKRELGEFQRYSELIDFSRDVDFTDMSSEALTRAGDLEKERPHSGSGRLAILVADPLTYGLARTYSTFASESRSAVHISYDFDDCLNFMGFSNHRRRQIESVIHLNVSTLGNIYMGSQLEFHFPAAH